MIEQDGKENELTLFWLSKNCDPENIAVTLQRELMKTGRGAMITVAAAVTYEGHWWGQRGHGGESGMFVVWVAAEPKGRKCSRRKTGNDS